MDIVTLALSKKYTNTRLAELATAGFTPVKVDTLPEIEDADTGSVYLVPADEQTDENKYLEYLVVENRWECIGSTAIDLGDYSTTSETINLIQEQIADHESSSLPWYTLEDLTQGVEYDFTTNNSSAKPSTNMSTIRSVGMDITKLKPGIYVPILNGQMYHNVTLDFKLNLNQGYNPNRCAFFIVPTRVTGNEPAGTTLAIWYGHKTNGGLYSGPSLYYKPTESANFMSATDYGEYYVPRDASSTIKGTHTYNVLPKTSVEPTDATHFVNKSYVDTSISNAVDEAGRVFANYYTKEEVEQLIAQAVAEALGTTEAALDEIIEGGE